ncbi:MAG: hypothetical protein K5675_10720 [Lachnospiraceae bacterium]|nr:hypothetical protein [Lachnospiraceae bacterium]
MVSIKDAKQIMGDNFIGPDELSNQTVMNFLIDDIPEITFELSELQKKSKDYMLILCVSRFKDGKPVTIRNLIDVFGKNPDEYEPCFYNQDWYEKETFIDNSMKNEWFFIRKEVFEDSRAVMPEDLTKKYTFPTAVSCCYAFFVSWICKDIKLWYHDFVWCRDTDHNGDRIYVGKYHDVDGVNKNGFSIHRHLGLRDCYGCVE